MQSLSLHPTSSKPAPDLAQEVERLAAELAARRAELSALQEEVREFKARYTQLVGSRMAELAEVEAEIKRAEARLLGLEDDETEAEEAAPDADEERAAGPGPHGATSLRKLFWSVARLFHPDYAGDEREARRRHAVMAEASRAYREGDVESLHTLLGDERLQSFCATAHASDEPADLATRLINLKEELRTVEFGLKRLRLDGMYRLKLSAAAEAEAGRDLLAQMAARLDRQITKARHRLEHLS